MPTNRKEKKRKEEQPQPQLLSLSLSLSHLFPPCLLSSLFLSSPFFPLPYDQARRGSSSSSRKIRIGRLLKGEAPAPMMNFLIDCPPVRNRKQSRSIPKSRAVLAFDECKVDR